MSKSIGPRIDTCGTPQVNDFWEDFILYISMYCFLSVKLLLNHKVATPLMPHLLCLNDLFCIIRFHDLWCQTLSKGPQRQTLCSDRAPGIVYFGYWFGTVGKYYTLNSL